MHSPRVLLVSCLLVLGCAQPVTSLVRSEDIAPGNGCVAGGKRLSFGADKDGNGTLADAEVSSSTVVCNGEQGTLGPKGETGNPGADGAAGKSVVTGVAAASAEDCPHGGSVFMAGLDDDADGALDIPAEVDTTVKACNGAAGASGFNSLVTTLDEPRGLTCPAGGVRLDVGVDNGDGSGTAGDGILQSGEIDETRFVCADYDRVFRVASASAVNVVTPAIGTELPMTVAWDGTSYWFASGTDQQGGRLVKTDEAFVELGSFTGSGSTYSYRGIASKGDGLLPLLATVQQETTVYAINSATGGRVSFRLMYPPHAPEAQLSWDATVGEWVARSGTTYGRYDPSFNQLGTFQGPTVPGNSSLAVLALKGKVVLYEDAAKRLTVFSRDGVALEQLTLADGPTACNGLSLAHGKVWLSDGPTQSFKAYDVLR